MKQGDLLQIVRESMALDEARNPENEPINKIIRKLGDFELLSNEEKKILEASGIEILAVVEDLGWTAIMGPNGEETNSDEIEHRVAESNGDFDFYNWLTIDKGTWEYEYDYNDPTKMSVGEYRALQPYHNEKNAIMSSNGAIMSAKNEIKKAKSDIRKAKKDKASILAKARAEHGKKNESLIHRRINESASGTWSDALWDAVDEELVDAKDLCFSFIKYLSEDEVEDFCRYNDLVDLVDEDDYDDIDESCSKKSKVGSKKNNEKMNESVDDKSYHDSLVDIVTKAYTECSDSYKEQMYNKVLEINPDADPEDYSMFTDLDSIELEEILLPLIEESVLPEAEVPALVLYRIYNAIASQSWGDSYEEGWVRGYSRASDEASR